MRPITYRDLDGEPVTEDFYFHYSVAEAVEMKVVFGDDIQAKIQALLKAQNGQEIVMIFKGIIADSIGKKSANNKNFIKTPELREEFMGSDAYSEMLLWLLSDQKNMATFVNGIFPPNMAERVNELVAKREAEAKTTTTVDLPKEDIPAFKLPKAPSIQSPIGSTPRPTAKSFIDMTPEEFSEWKTNQ